MGRYKTSPIIEIMVGDVQTKVKPCRKCGKVKVLTEFYENDGGAGGRHSSCKKCHSLTGADWTSRNSEKKLATNLAWRAANNVRERRAERARYALDPEKHLKKSKAWHSKHPDYKVAYTRNWEKQNPGRTAVLRTAGTSSRKASKLNATPSWANKFFISEAYHLAKLREKCTGIKWHVDHIVPLQSKKVCGLHVEHNLQVIPATENLKKHNTYWPDMP